MLAEPLSLDISEGSIFITKTGYKRTKEETETPYTGAYVISGEVSEKYWIEVQSGTHQITLNGLKLVSPQFDPSFDIWKGAEVELDLAEGTENEIKSGYNHAGIEVPEGARLTIKGGGSLRAQGGYYGAGIGGGSNPNAGEIVIESGIITALAGSYGAGIGGGSYGAGGTIQILGGDVTAEGELYSAGIGGGRCGAAGTIRIEGGVVTAQGGKHGARNWRRMRI